MWLFLLNQVCCDGCNVWIHAECAKIPHKFLKVCYHAQYYAFFFWHVYFSKLVIGDRVETSDEFLIAGSGTY